MGLIVFVSLFVFTLVTSIFSGVYHIIMQEKPTGKEILPISIIFSCIFVFIWSWWIQNNSTKLFILINNMRFNNSTLLFCDTEKDCVTLGVETYFTFEKTLTKTDDWVYEVGERKPFDRTVEIIFNKFKDIEDRLSKAFENKADLQKKYGKDFSVEKIDADIKYLSNIGWQLVEPTKRFFEIAKQQMMKIDEANARAEAMQGLKTFTEQIEAAGNQPSEALEQSVADITAAIDNLEKTMNQ